MVLNIDFLRALDGRLRGIDVSPIAMSSQNVTTVFDDGSQPAQCSITAENA